jgi:helix-turn-helix protein
MYKPQEVAKRWRVAVDKVLALIHSGQIRAINLAENPHGRPRWRITQQELERFELSRSTRPPVPKVRRRRQSLNSGKEWF